MSGEIVNRNLENEQSQDINTDSPPKKRWLLFGNFFTLGNIATLLGILGGIITVVNFVNQRPKLVLNTSKIELRSIFPKDEYIKTLEKIENDYYDYTGDIVTTLIENLNNIAINGSIKQENAKQFQARLIQSIEELKTEFGREVYEDIIEELNSMERELNNSEDITTLLVKLEDLEDKYSSYTKEYINDIIRITEKILEERNLEKREISEKILELKIQIKNTVLAFSTFAFQPTNDDDNEKKLISELEKVNSSLQGYMLGNHDRIFVEVAIENRSDLKNLVHNQGMITFFDPTDNFTQIKNIPYISVPISTTSGEPIIIEDRGLITLSFQSNNINDFDKSISESINTSFKESYRYIIVIEDINEKLWNSSGRISTGFNNKSASEKRLEEESEMLLRKFYK